MLSMVRTESGFTGVTCEGCACVEDEGVEGREEMTDTTAVKKSCTL